MMVRCGACRTQFDVPGAGRFTCPVCGSVNMVREQPQQGGSNMGGYPTAPGVAPQPGAQPPPPPANTPLPRIDCPECEFNFIVGEIAVAICPNCGAEVKTGRGTPEEE